MNHESVASRVETIAMTTGILAGLSAAGAALAEPEGLSAFGVWLGIADQPFIISAAPVIGNISTLTGVLSGMAYFWAKWQKSREKSSKAVNKSD